MEPATEGPTTTRPLPVPEVLTIFGYEHDDDHKLKICLPRSLGQTMVAMEEWEHRPKHDQAIRFFERKPDDPSFWVEIESIHHAMESNNIYAHVHPVKRTMHISAFGNVLKLTDITFPCTGKDVLLRLAQMPLDMSRTCLVMKPFDMSDKLIIVTPDMTLLFASDGYHLGVRTLKRKAEESQLSTESPVASPPKSKIKS